MKIYVLSDTHGKLRILEKFIDEVLNQDDTLLFLGDGLKDFRNLDEKIKEKNIRLYCVCGNCDFFGNGEVPDYQLVEIEGYRIGLTHGHRFGVKSSLTKLDYFSVENNTDVMLYGHTHISKMDFSSNGKILFNPGSLGEPRMYPSYGVLEITDNGIIPYIYNF